MGGAGGGPVGGGDATGDLPAEGGAVGFGALDIGLGGFGAEGAFVAGFDDLGEVEEGVGVARVDEAGAAPGAGVFRLEEEAGVGFAGGLEAGGFGGVNAGAGGVEELVGAEAFFDGLLKGERPGGVA